AAAAQTGLLDLADCRFASERAGGRECVSAAARDVFVERRDRGEKPAMFTARTFVAISARRHRCRLSGRAVRNRHRARVSRKERTGITYTWSEESCCLLARPQARRATTRSSSPIPHHGHSCSCRIEV